MGSSWVLENFCISKQNTRFGGGMTLLVLMILVFRRFEWLVMRMIGYEDIKNRMVNAPDRL